MVADYFKEALILKEKILDDADFLSKIQNAIEAVSLAYKNGNKVLITGNSGSAVDAQHFVGEIVCTFMRKNRRAYPAIALTTDTSVITARSNDFGYETVFARQVEALGKLGDVFTDLLTSGNSENIIQAVKKLGSLS